MSINSTGPALFMEGQRVRSPKMVLDSKGKSVLGVTPLQRGWVQPKEYPERQSKRVLRL